MTGGTSIVAQITNVFTEMATWISTTLPTVTKLFYESSTGLTFLGTLCVIGLGISVFFLLMRLIQNFLHLRG